MRLLAGFVVAVVVISCTPKAKAPTLSSGGRLVQVAKGDPPAGAKEIGPITATDGTYCSDDDVGTYAHALVKLRNRAAARGGNYVEIMTMKEPYEESRLCYDGRFVIRGMLYEIPSASSDESAGTPSDADKCDPPCSPGFECDDGTCDPVCNPECPPGQVCRRDRTCGPPT